MKQSTIARSFFRGIFLSAVTMILALLTSLLAIAQPERASTYEVTNSNNSGPGSLRQAIDDANNNPGADTITFAAATDGNPIVLAGATNENGNASGDLDILDGGDLIIQGNGAANTIIDGGGIDRVIHICPGGGCANTVSFADVTIRNGFAGNGGGIYNNAGMTTVKGSTVSANFGETGGGIYNNAGMTTVKGSTVSANRSGDGGGIANNYGTIIVNGSTISANTADVLGGGGIFNYSGTTTVIESTVSANTASRGYGGGIYNSGTTTVIESTVSANTGLEGGGGIYNRGALIVQNSSIIGVAGAGNKIGRGGGIYNDGTTTLDGSTISAHTVEFLGGGIYNDGTLNVQNGSTVSANTVTDYGGGIYNGGTTTVDNSTISANTAGVDGGGISNIGGTLIVLNGSTIGGTGVGNSAVLGGGIHNWGTTTVTGSSILNNTAANNGGGIINVSGTTTVIGSSILNNTAANNGGGVYNASRSFGATSVTGSCIVGNSAKSYVNSHTELQIATGNWWGAATGPNTPGADTYDGNVDVSGYLTVSICDPDLQMSKANDVAGNSKVGIPFHWTLTVSNTGHKSATLGAAQTILIDDLPAGPIYGAPVTGSFVDMANSANIHCSLADNTLICAAEGGDVTLEPLTGSFEVTFSVTPNTPETLVNPAGICQIDPNGNVIEGDESNNGCPENIVNIWTNHLYLPVVRRWY